MFSMNARTAGGHRRGPLSYANVVSTLALVLAVGGGSALAAGSLAASHKPKPHLTLNSADKAYVSAQIAAGHVAFATNAASATNATNATNATTAANATHATTADTASSAKIATNIYSANVAGNGTLLSSIPTGATSSRNALGDYRVGFGRAITGCTIAVSPSSNTGPQLGFAAVGVIDANTLQVFTRDSTNTVADLGFYIQAICPAS